MNNVADFQTRVEKAPLLSFLLRLMLTILHPLLSAAATDAICNYARPYNLQGPEATYPQIDHFAGKLTSSV